MSDRQPLVSAPVRPVLLAITLPMFLAMIDQTIVATALTAIAADLGHVEWVSWVVVCYLMAAAVSAPVYGRLGDTFGHRRVAIAALTISGIGSLLCSLAPSLPLLMASRVLQGLGGGGLMSLSQAMLAEVIQPRQRARYQGFISTVAVTASTIGPVAGGLMSESLGWRSIFLIGLPVTVAAIILVYRAPIPTTSRRSFHLDAFGLLLLSAMICTLLISLRLVGDPIAAPLTIILLFIITIMSLAAMCWWIPRAADPIIPVDLFRNRSILGSNLLAVCHGALLISLYTVAPLYFQIMGNMSLGDAALLMVPMTVAIAVSSAIGGQIIGRTGLTIAISASALALVALLYGVLAVASSHLSVLAVALLFASVTAMLGPIMTVVFVTVQSEADVKILGSATATILLCRTVGAALGTALASIVFFQALQRSDPGAIALLEAFLRSDGAARMTVSDTLALHEHASDAFSFVFIALAGVALIAVAISQSISRKRI